MSAIKIFEDKKVRSHYDLINEIWYFSIIDIIEILTNQPHYQGARNYWKVFKKQTNKRRK